MNAGMATAARMPMMATTTMSSIRVKPPLIRFVMFAIISRCLLVSSLLVVFVANFFEIPPLIPEGIHCGVTVPIALRDQVVPVVGVYRGAVHDDALGIARRNRG